MTIHMATSTLKALFVLAPLSFAVIGCIGADSGADESDEDGTVQEAEQAVSYPLCRWWGGGNPVQVSQDTMNHLYYDINPNPHSEKAYQSGDPSPPIAVPPTYADASGSITVLQTSLYNRSCNPGPCYGTTATFRVHSPRGTVMCEDSGPIPFRINIPNVVPGGKYYIQPMTVNTMAKILPTNLAQ
jgi:hypothetical protein